MITTYENLILTALSEEQHKNTCGYWYTVTTSFTPHTAFATRDALIRWMNDRGLSVDGQIPDRGNWGWLKIVGSYRKESHFGQEQEAAFYALEGEEIRLMDNARYTKAIITQDDDGIRTVHYLNCNVKDRPEYDRSECNALYR